MTIPHPERHRWVKVISGINKKINETASASAAKVAAKVAKPPRPQRNLSGVGGFHWSADENEEEEGEGEGG